MFKSILPSFLFGAQITALKNAIQSLINNAVEWMAWPLKQLDLAQCNINVVVLIGWQRGIERLNTEPEALFRLRVKYAYINNQDAGTKGGLGKILNRLGIDYISIEERKPGYEWDEVIIKLDDSVVSEYGELIREVINLYGRTCRRYRLSSYTRVPLFVNTVEFGHDSSTYIAR